MVLCFNGLDRDTSLHSGRSGPSDHNLTAGSMEGAPSMTSRISPPPGVSRQWTGPRLPGLRGSPPVLPPGHAAPTCQGDPWGGPAPTGQVGFLPLGEK